MRSSRQRSSHRRTHDRRASGRVDPALDSFASGTVDTGAAPEPLFLSGSVGLGTAFAPAYAESFGGTIEYLRENERTVFEVRLPAAVADTAAALV